MTQSRPRLYPSETFDFMFRHVVEELRKSGHPYRVKAIAPDIHGVYGARFEFSDFNIVILNAATDFFSIEPGRNENTNLLCHALARVRSLQKVDTEQKREHVTYQFALAEAWGSRRHYTRLQIQGNAPQLFDPQWYTQRNLSYYWYLNKSNEILKEKKFDEVQPTALSWQGPLDHHNCGRFVGYSAGQPVRDALKLAAHEAPEPELLERKFKWVGDFRDCCSSLPEYRCIAEHPSIKSVRMGMGPILTEKMIKARASAEEFNKIELDEEEDTRFEGWYCFADKKNDTGSEKRKPEEIKFVGEHKDDQQQKEKQLLQQEEQARLAEVAAAERRRAEEQARLAEVAAAERRRAAEEVRLREEAAAERSRAAEQVRLREEAAAAERSRVAEEVRLKEEAAAAAERSRVAEQARLEAAAAERNRVAEQVRLREEAAIAERNRVEEARLREEAAAAERRRVESKRNVLLGAVLTALTMVALVVLFPQYFIVKGLMSIISALTYCAPGAAQIGAGVVAFVGGGLLGGAGVAVGNVFFGSCCRDDSSSNGIRRSSSQAKIMREVGREDPSDRDQPLPSLHDYENGPHQDPFSRSKARGEGGQRPNEVVDVARVRIRSH